MVKYPQIDKEKIELAKEQLRKKSTVWFSFLLLGWSYGSLGKLGVQMLWYAIPIATAYGIYENQMTNDFTVFTSIAVLGLPSWLVWGVARMFTLNKAVEHYNRKVADFFGLNPEEKYYLGID